MKKSKSSGSSHTIDDIGAGLTILIIPIMLTHILISVPRATIAEQYYEVCPTTQQQSWATKLFIEPEMRKKPDPPCTAVVQNYGWPAVAKRIVFVTKNHDGFYPESPKQIQNRAIASRYWLSLFLITLVLFVLIDSNTSKKPKNKRK